MMIHALGEHQTSTALVVVCSHRNLGKGWIQYYYSWYSFSAHWAMTTCSSGTVDTRLCSAQCSGAVRNIPDILPF